MLGTILGTTFEIAALGASFFLSAWHSDNGTKELALQGSGEEAVGELLEEIIEGLSKLVGKLPAHFQKKKIIAATMAEMAKTAKKYVKLGDKNAYDGFFEYLNRLEKDKKGLKEKTDKYNDLLNEAKTSKEKRAEAPEKLFRDVEKAMAKEQFSSWEYMSLDNFIRQYCDENPPEYVREFMEIIYTCSFKLKYVSMGEDSRDVVKLIQQIVEEKHESLLESMKSFFYLIQQQNAQVASGVGTEVLSTETASKAIALVRDETDLLIWYEHVCPRCGARGDLIHRTGKELHCMACGEYSLVGEAPSETAKAAMATADAQDGVVLYTEEQFDFLKKLIATVEEDTGEIKDINKAILQINREIKENTEEIRKTVEKTDKTVGELKGIAVESKERDKRMEEKLNSVIERLDEPKPSPLPVPESPPVPTPPTRPKTCCQFCGRTDAHWDDETHKHWCGYAEGDSILDLIINKNDHSSYWEIVPSPSESAPAPAAAARWARLQLVSSMSWTRSVQKRGDVDVSRAEALVLWAKELVQLTAGRFLNILRGFKNSVRCVILSGRVQFAGVSVTGWTYDKSNKRFVKND